MGEYQNFLVKADTERLLEVLQNIIENAIKYGSGKKIGISILTASIVAPMQEIRKEADWGFIYAES